MTVSTASRLGRYVLVFLRWLLVGWVVFTLTSWLGFYITNNILPQIYIAQATMQVPPADLAIPTGGDTSASGPFQPVFENSIRAPDFLLPLIKDLNLETAWASRMSPSAQDQVPDVDALTRMEDLLKFSVSKDTNLVTIAAASNDPKEAADIANAIARRYATLRAVALPSPDQSASPDTQELRDEIAKQQKVVEDKKAEVEKLQQKFGGPERMQDDTRFEARQKALLAAQAEYDARASLLAKTTNVSDDDFIETLAGADDIASDFNARLGTLQSKSPPDRAKISDLIARYRTAMKINLDMSKAHVGRLQKEVNDLAAITQEQSPEFLAAQRDLKVDQDQLDALNLRLVQATSSAPLPQAVQSPVHIISFAEIPTIPAHPNKSLAFFVIMVGSSVMAVLAASFAEVILLLIRASERTEN